MLTGSDSIEDMADDFKVIGYDINSVRAYSESKSSQSADEFFARKVSVGDSGSFTCVGLCAIPENAIEISHDASKLPDVQVDDIWEAIPNAE